ncbi:hypothetical protein PABG_12151 [Paracoccidioides brasiliensis Pb03]|nr:hypothetical protein PABG_12151 [Paracoccidioides brasiliensis Pb03]
MRGPSPRLSRRMIHKADPRQDSRPGLPYGSVQVVRVEEAQLEKLADAREWSIDFARWLQFVECAS